MPGSVLLFEANDDVRDVYVDRWAAAPDRDALQLDTDGLASFVSEAHDRLVGPTPDVGTLERQRTIERALEEGVTIEDGRRYSDAFSELVRALESHGVLTPDDVAEELQAGTPDPELVEEIVTAFERYCDHRDELVHPHAVTRSRKFLDVANASGSLAAAFPAVDHVIVSGYVEPSPVEIAVLKRVIEAFPTTVVVPALHRGNAAERTGPEPAGTDAALSATLAAYEPFDLEPEYVPPDEERTTCDVAGRLYTTAVTETPVDATTRLSWHEAPTPDREVRHLARRIREQVATTEVDLEDVLVLAPGLLSYRERIDDIFAEFEIPYVANASILLERTYAGRAVLDAVALCTDPDAEHLVRLATSPVVSLEGIDAGELTSLVRRLPSSDVDVLRGYAEPSLRESLDDVLDRAAAVRRADGVATLDAFGQLLDSFAIRSNVATLESRDAVDFEERAIRRVRRILDSLVPVFSQDVDDPMAELEGALQGVRVPPPKQLPDGRVRFVGLEDVPMTDYEHLYVLGATREALPATPDRPRYFQTVGDALGLFPADRDRDIARYRFGLALANAETVHVTTSAETMQGEELLPSPMLDELRSVAAIDRSSGVENEPRSSREDVQRALAGTDPDRLDDPLTAAVADGVFSPGQADAIRAGTTTAANRARPEPTVHDGQLDSQTVSSLSDDLTREPYSPSRLNTYAKCGFRYYLNTGLDLAEPDDISPDAGRFAIGDVVHTSLEYFYADLIAERDGPVDLAEYDRDELERRLLDAGQRAVETTEADFESPFDRHRLGTVFAGLATPGENPFVESRGGVDERTDVSGLLATVLDRELRDDGGHPRFVEAWFGNDETPATLDDGTAVPVHGVIDRVDLEDRENGDLAARVVDYKTYNRDARDAIQGLDFQLPAYLFGVRSLITQELGERPDAVDGEYRVLRPPGTVSHKAPLGQRVEWDLDATVEEFLTEVASDRIERAVTGIESGAFQPATVGADDAGCHNCDYATVCDVRHHRRFESIEAIDAEGHLAYVPAGARHGDLMEHVSLGRSGGDD